MVIMATLTKLLIIKMVASNSLGFATKSQISLSGPLLFASQSSSSELDNEKNATSEPDIMAEKTNNRSITPTVRIRNIKVESDPPKITKS